MGKNDTATAIYGGSFDPPHLGHREVIKRVLSLEDIDRVVVVPSWLNPFKDSFHAPAQKRYEWCKAIFGDIDGVEISDFEILQHRAVYTVETYKKLSQIYPITHIVIGADNLASIDKWRDFATLNNSIEWIVAKRRGYDIVTSKLRCFKIIQTDTPISSSDIRRGKGLEYIDDRIIDEVKSIYQI